VYSLAAVAYFALAGTPPFRAADSSMQAHLSVMHQQVFSEPPPLSVHRPGLAPGIDAAVRRGLAKDPEARYPSAGQLASALRSAVVAASGAPEQPATAVTSRRISALIGGLAGAALLAGGAVFVWDREQSAPLLPARHSLTASRSAAVPPTSVVFPVVPPVQSKPNPLVAAKPKPKAVLLARRPAPASHLPRIARSPRIARRISEPLRIARALPRHTAGLEHRFAAPAARTRKIAVTGHRKYRRRPVLLAQIKPAVLVVASKPRVAAGTAWLSVYARQNSLLAGKTTAIPAQTVTVDGKPVSALANGGWAALPAGKHLIAYVPAGQSGFGRNPGLWVTLAPGAHLSRQVLLPVSIAGGRNSVSALTASAAPVKPITPIAPILPTPPQSTAAALAAVPASVGWYTVSGWIVRNPSAPKPTLVRTSAQWVKVDGVPVLSLAMGQWAELSAGKHTITFQPTVGVGVAAKTWDINLSPQAHLDQKIPLPPSPLKPNY
jgi:hypothetical protein